MSIGGRLTVREGRSDLSFPPPYVQHPRRLSERRHRRSCEQVRPPKSLPRSSIASRSRYALRRSRGTIIAADRTSAIRRWVSAIGGMDQPTSGGVAGGVEVAVLAPAALPINGWSWRVVHAPRSIS